MTGMIFIHFLRRDYVCYGKKISNIPLLHTLAQHIYLFFSYKTHNKHVADVIMLMLICRVYVLSFHVHMH
jgi:hypothetical protein